jgi:prepilin-type N-terminal cleavage/methylation domain-containing protein
MSPRHGFTLLEIMLAIVIGLLLMSVAVPSVVGMMKEQKLKQTYEEFDDFVRKAQIKAVESGQTQVMVWDAAGINLIPQSVEEAEKQEAPEHFTFADDTTWSLVRPAALVKKPVWEWPFWRSGVCEPVIVNYEGPAGKWSAEYNGLTGRGKLIETETK